MTDAPSAWVEVPAPSAIRRQCAPGTRVFQRRANDGGYLFVIVSREPRGWHLSISHQLRIVDPFTGKHLTSRLPTWDEMKAARYRFVPDDCVMAQVLPPTAAYVNVHPTAMHLWELPADIARTFTEAEYREPASR